MTTGWLLLMLLLVSFQSVDSQSTTDNETWRYVFTQLQRDIERILDNQQKLFKQHLTLLDNQQQLFERIGKC